MPNTGSVRHLNEFNKGLVRESMLPIYLDYAATTPVDPRVAEKMSAALTLTGVFGNPASRSHYYGWQAEAAVEKARNQVADLINADTREIVWTSGATESDNLAIKGVAHYYRKKGRHIVTSQIEHKAVLDACKQLEREGFEVTYLVPDERGIISPSKVAEAIKEDTLLVSLMHINNELGTINDIDAIAELTSSRGVLFHVDAAQSVGKLPLDMEATKVDLLSISAHKIYGPKGIGALYVRRKPSVCLEPQMHGGGHERGMRAGTLATHQIIGLGEACELAGQTMVAEYRNMEALRSRFLSGLKRLEAVAINGHFEKFDFKQHFPGILNIRFPFVDGESLIMSLKDLAVSSGSACTSASIEPSYVLRAVGLTEELAHSSIRFSIGRFTTESDIDSALEQIRFSVDKLRELSAEWRERAVSP